MATSLLTSYLNPSMAAHHTHIPSRGPQRAFAPPHLCPADPAVILPPPGRGLLFRHRHMQRGTRRGEDLVARAGPPSTATLVFAFVFPLSLVVGTVFASIRIADQLDQKYLEELMMNKAIMEEAAEDEGEDELEEEEDGDVAGLKEQLISAAAQVASAAPQRRNRPKREA